MMKQMPRSAAGTAWPVRSLPGLNDLYDITNSLQTHKPPKAGLDNKVGSLAFFPIWHLLCQDVLKFFRRHRGTLKHALGLHKSRRRHRDYGVAARLAASLKQQRHIKDHHRNTAPGHDRQERMPPRANQWMDNRLNAPKLIGVAEDRGTEFLTIDTSSGNHPGERSDRKSGV